MANKQVITEAKKHLQFNVLLRFCFPSSSLFLIYILQCRMMNFQTGIKFLNGDSPAVSAVDQLDVNGQLHGHCGSSQWLYKPSSLQVHCAKGKSFMTVIYTDTLATELPTESLQQQAGLHCVTESILVCCLTQGK